MLRCKWKNAEKVAPDTDVSTGDTAEEAEAKAEKKMAPKPIMVYVTDGADNAEHTKIEKVVLMNEEISILMNNFDCLKVSPEVAKDDPLLKEHGKACPRFIIFNRDYSKPKVFEGKSMKTKKVLTALKKAAKHAYKTPIDKYVKEIRKLVNEYNKINGAMKVIEGKRSRGDLSKKDKKKLAELEQAQKDAEAKEKKFLTYELRVKEKAKAEG